MPARLDLTITLGTIIHLVVLLGALVGLWGSIDSRLARVETEVRSHGRMIERLVNHAMPNGGR